MALRPPTLVDEAPAISYKVAFIVNSDKAKDAASLLPAEEGTLSRGSDGCSDPGISGGHTINSVDRQETKARRR
jgi:hypothetical protein